MNAISTPPAPVGGLSAPDGDIDASCRTPLFVMFAGAAAWLAVASVLGILASLKFHSPDLFAGCAWLSYGRLQPAATLALLYGFAVPAGLGVGLWISATLSGRRVSRPWLIALGAKLWNLGVFVG